MSKVGILKAVRLTLLSQTGIAILVLLICWLMGWFYLYTIGIAFMYVGFLILVVFIFLFFGGSFSSAEDLSAFSLSGAGKMEDHIKRVRHTEFGRLGFLATCLVNGLIPVFIGHALQVLGQ